MATDEERDGDRTKITLAAHGDTIEIMPGLGGRIIVSLDDGEGSINALVGVEEQEMVIAAIRRAQGREQGATVPRAGVEALRDELVDFQKRYVLGGMTETRVDRIVTMVDALLAAPATQTEKG